MVVVVVVIVGEEAAWEEPADVRRAGTVTSRRSNSLMPHKSLKMFIWTWVGREEVRVELMELEKRWISSAEN